MQQKAATYKRAILYLASRAPREAKREGLSNTATVRFAAYLWGKPTAKIADDILAFEREAQLGQRLQNKDRPHRASGERSRVNKLEGCV